MKRSNRPENAPVAVQPGPDIAGLISSLQQQLASIDRKIDSLISRSQPKAPEIKTFPSNLQFPPRPPAQQIPAPKQDNGNRPRERILHKAVCADCNKNCEVPFKPSGDRPVYCKDCFSKRKSVNGFNNARPNAGVAVSKYSQPAQSDKKPPAEHKKPAEKKTVEKKKPSPKKRKAKK